MHNNVYIDLIRSLCAISAEASYDEIVSSVCQVRMSEVERWGVNQVSSFLLSLSTMPYNTKLARLFEHECITGDCLLILNEGDFFDLAQPLTVSSDYNTGRLHVSYSILSFIIRGWKHGLGRFIKRNLKTQYLPPAVIAGCSADLSSLSVDMAKSLVAADLDAATTGRGLYYGQLTVLGYSEYREETNGKILPQGRANEVFKLRRRRIPNGLKLLGSLITNSSSTSSTSSGPSATSTPSTLASSPSPSPPPTSASSSSSSSSALTSNPRFLDRTQQQLPLTHHLHHHPQNSPKPSPRSKTLSSSAATHRISWSIASSNLPVPSAGNSHFFPSHPHPHNNTTCLSPSPPPSSTRSSFVSIVNPFSHSLSLGNNRHRRQHSYSKKSISIEYGYDPTKDIFQIGRLEAGNDFVVKGPLHTDDAKGLNLQFGPVSRYGCRIECERTPPFKCFLYAGGFDPRGEMNISDKAPKIVEGTERGTVQQRLDSYDALTTYGVKLWQPSQRRWVEVSVRGRHYTPRPSTTTPSLGNRILYSYPQQYSQQCNHIPFSPSSFPSSPDAPSPYELVTGSIIDLCGVRILFSKPRRMSEELDAASPESIVADFNALKPVCPVQFLPLTLSYLPHHERALRAMKRLALETGYTNPSPLLVPPVDEDDVHCSQHNRPWVYTACGHIFSYHKSMQGKPCPLCRKMGDFKPVALPFEPSIDIGKPTHVFNPCGHVASKEVCERFSSIPLLSPQDNVEIPPACPFCATPLHDECRGGPYNKIIFQTEGSHDDSWSQDIDDARGEEGGDHDMQELTVAFERNSTSTTNSPPPHIPIAATSMIPTSMKFNKSNMATASGKGSQMSSKITADALEKAEAMAHLRLLQREMIDLPSAHNDVLKGQGLIASQSIPAFAIPHSLDTSTSSSSSSTNTTIFNVNSNHSLSFPKYCPQCNNTT